MTRSRFVLLVAAALARPCAAACAPAPAAVLGLWASELRFDPRARGELRIERDGRSLRATIAGASARFEPRGDSLAFVLPGSRDRFRGAWEPGRGAIAGFWLQSWGEWLDPHHLGSPACFYATPVLLRQVGRDAWRGRVTPLADRFTLFLSLTRDAGDSLVVVLRNPEFNLNLGATRFRGVVDGDSLRLYARPDTTRPQIQVTAALAHHPDRVRLRWPSLDRVVELTRPTAALAGAFLPRPPGVRARGYEPPARGDDGWPTARAAAVGMDEDSLSRVVARLSDTDPNAPRPALIHSLLIARRGRLVLETYDFGFDRTRVHDSRSASKAFGSVLVGVAMRQGAPIAPETPIYPLLAAMGPFAHPDPRKARITLAQLMTHTSGLACDDNDDDSPGNEGVMQGQRDQPDWWRYTLDLPVAFDPGSHYAYCSGGMNLVGAALSTATGRWIPEMFEREIARPLGFGRYYWNLSPALQSYTGGGVYLRPRDLLKLGQTYLDGGVWQGRRIVDSSWVARSTSPRFTTGEGTADGFGWHLNTLRSAGREYHEYEANGNGGQFLMIVPELDLAVVFTAGNFGQYGIWRHFRDDILAHEIIPAVRDR